jgi:DDE superfamily endonuclease
VPLTGQKAKRVLFGGMNFQTGPRIVLRRHQQRQADFHAFLPLVRTRSRNKPLALLWDRASCHDAATSHSLAAPLPIKLLWLPQQWSALKVMDQLGKALKRRIAANRQFKTIDQQAEYAEKWVLGLSNRRALRKAGVLSKNFWLRNV